MRAVSRCEIKVRMELPPYLADIHKIPSPLGVILCPQGAAAKQIRSQSAHWQAKWPDTSAYNAGIRRFPVVKAPLSSWSSASWLTLLVILVRVALVAGAIQGSRMRSLW